MGDTHVQAGYQSASEETSLIFGYTVQPGVNGSVGIPDNSSIDLNGGTIKNVDADAALALSKISSKVLVDTTAPTVSAATPATSATGYR